MLKGEKIEITGEGAYSSNKIEAHFAEMAKDRHAVLPTPEAPQSSLPPIDSEIADQMRRLLDMGVLRVEKGKFVGDNTKMTYETDRLLITRSLPEDLDRLVNPEKWEKIDKEKAEREEGIEEADFSSAA